MQLVEGPIDDLFYRLYRVDVIFYFLGVSLVDAVSVTEMYVYPPRRKHKL
jgi:hypothetical protein